MGCCMCEAGCDHSKETSKTCKYPEQTGPPLGSNPGAIAGIAIGAVVVVGAIGFAVYKFVCKPKATAKGGAPEGSELASA